MAVWEETAAKMASPAAINNGGKLLYWCVLYVGPLFCLCIRGNLDLCCLQEEEERQQHHVRIISVCLCRGSGSREEGFVYTCIFVYTAKDGGNCHQNHLFLRSSRQACISRGKYQMLENLGYVLESNWREEIASLIFKMVWLKSCHWCRETHLREKFNAIRSWKHHKNSKKTQKKKPQKKSFCFLG